ncbi:MAG: Maf family protein [Pseudomonadota bacterium]
MSLHDFIYLASQSPRRRQLLDQLGVRHQLLVPEAGAEADAAEALEAVRPGELPADYVRRVTALKLQAARARLKARGLPAAPILCSDTTVAIGRRILGKPADAAEARAMLRALSGRSHRVLTAVALAAGPRRTLAALSVSTVRFAPLDDALVDAYIASGQPFGKAGGYAIQSQLAGWIPQVRGSYSAIMGLPLFETAQLLRQARVCF